jgi:hypothetical protein
MTQEKRLEGGGLNWRPRSIALRRKTFGPGSDRIAGTDKDVSLATPAGNCDKPTAQRCLQIFDAAELPVAHSNACGEAGATVDEQPLNVAPVTSETVTDSRSECKPKTKKRARRSRAEVQLANQNKQAGQPITPDTTYLTVNQACQMFPIFTPGALRSLIFNAGGTTKDIKGSERANRFSNVILRVPGQRRILICQQGLRDWLQSGR